MPRKSLYLALFPFSRKLRPDSNSNFKSHTTPVPRFPPPSPSALPRGMSFPYRNALISSLPTPFLLLPSSRSRHNLLDSLLSSFILSPLISSKDGSFGDAVILIESHEGSARCTIIVPTSLPNRSSHIKHSSYTLVLSPNIGYGDDIEEGYDFVQSHLTNILFSLPSVYMCIPEGWEPGEVPERYKGMEGFEGEVVDGSKEAWELFTCIDSSRMHPAVWDGQAVFRRVSSMVHKTRMNGTERKGLSLILMNDIVEEYETLSQIITVERREIERNCGKGVGGGGKVRRSDCRRNENTAFHYC